ncbi:hypothetical protein LSH36_108g04002 [Paralvinella palmiformis]|uniref:Mini-chromosome maintenance complex-binding protein n=1 Tax=Paralvinella palmiformis TaxID=53620 RepID=A0AAD9NC74_9ANNE|nr:hypothetical protein LSH36_108g04002 [Paralvinella palmiformis]
MFDPEFYLGVYEVESLKTGAKCLRSGKYRDLAECGPCEEIKLDSPQNVTMDRHTLYCVPVPAESDWKAFFLNLIYAFAKSSVCDLHNTSPSTSVTSEQMKRPLDEDKISCPEADLNNEADLVSMEVEVNVAESKKTKIDASDEDGKSVKEYFDLNFPLPNEKGPACIVKMYQLDESVKLNDVVEVTGILSNHPAMASFPDRKQAEKSSALLDPSPDLMEGMEETSSSAPPPSLVPRLHAISVCQLQHNNPLLSSAAGSVIQGEAVLAEAGVLRDQLMTVLTQLFAGDHVAAEYLLCHLISSVYARRDVAAVGKFALNLSGCPPGVSFPKLLHEFIKQLVTKCYLLPLSLENMNKLSLVPKKDYKVNRLKSGILQLSNGTHLILDETALQPGQLDSNGVANMTALGNMISWQKLDYDFSFHKQEFLTDIIPLVLSEGKSIIKLIEEDFVNTRKEDSSKMSIDDFHSLLLLSRLLSLTYGKKSLTQEIWNRAKLLEVERKTRLVLTSVPQNR